MKYQVSLEKINTVNDLKNYWSSIDMKNLLEAFNFEGYEQLKDEELQEFLFLAINDFEPREAATIVLTYKLDEHLSLGQIDQLSNEMLTDKVAEDYSEISLHKDLFNINQLLYIAYNGTFPNTKASIISCSIEALKNQKEIEFTKEIVLKALCAGLNDHNIIKRLFEDQLAGKKPFLEAENILWEIKNIYSSKYEITTSDYWISKEDFNASEFEATINLFEEEED